MALSCGVVFAVGTEKAGGSSGRGGCCACCRKSPPGKPRRDIVPGDADDELPRDDPADGGGGLLWDDPDFPTPSSIAVSGKTFTGIEWLRPPVSTGYGTGSLGHRVNGSFGSSFTSGSPGHHVDPA